MGEVGEGLGGAVEGGLLARAVEPEAGEGEGWNDSGACLNCGTELLGPHCHSCGQKARLHRTISAFMQDLLHGALHFEGKMWHTLPLLVFKPGQLTRRYIDGERARFVSPMVLFLFSVFLMFAVFQAIGITAPTDIKPNGNVAAGLEAAHSEMETELEQATAALEAMEAGDPRREAAEKRVSNAQEALKALQFVEGFDLSDNARFTIRPTGIEAIDDGLVKKWRENPGLMLYKLQANSYKFSWLLIPISIPFVWLLFAWKRRFKAYDHAIFVTYSLAFMSLLFITISVLQTVGVPLWPLTAAFFIIPPIHIYKQLRSTYDLSRFAAFWRLLVMSAFIWIIIGFFLQLLLLLGAF